MSEEPVIKNNMEVFQKMFPSRGEGLWAENQLMFKQFYLRAPDSIYVESYE